MSVIRTTLAALLVAALALTTACQPPGAARYSRQQAQTSLKKLGAPGLLLGEFHLTKVTDGDTIRVDGLDSSLRLIGLDAEETFKNESDRRGAEDFENYLKEKRGSGKHPVKAATPLGEDAKHFAQAFFHDHTKVRIERDTARRDPRSLRSLPRLRVRREGRQVGQLQRRVRARRHVAVLHEVRLLAAVPCRLRRRRGRGQGRGPRHLDPRRSALS
jgi:endonuclease YncB( thermonuclease family)